MLTVRQTVNQDDKAPKTKKGPSRIFDTYKNLEEQGANYCNYFETESRIVDPSVTKSSSFLYFCLYVAGLGICINPCSSPSLSFLAWQTL